MRGRSSTNQRATALERAGINWDCIAVVMRGDVRAKGTRGPLRHWDDRAQGKRGRSVPRTLFGDALQAARDGIEEDVAVMRYCTATEHTVRLAYAEARTTTNGAA